MQLLSTIAAFILALGLLIVFHEFGHYLVARLAGVKVLRFAVGFGTPLLKRRFGRDQTEWVIAAFPLGGYVKMLDEREGDVDPADLPRAFNRQPVYKRFAIVSAGPIANFLLAILLYWVLFLHGVPGLRPFVGDAAPGSPAAQAQLASGDLITRVGTSEIPSWQDFRWALLDHAVRRDIVVLEVHRKNGTVSFPKLDLSGITPDDIDRDLVSAIGVTRYNPPIAPVIGRIVDGGAAHRDGLQDGDRVLSLDGVEVTRWDMIVETVRAAPGRPLLFEVERAGRNIRLGVVADAVQEDGNTIGRIGAAPRIDEAQMQELMTEVRYGPLQSVWRAAAKMTEVSFFTVKMLGRMVIGEVSLKNLSGPLTIADYAGQSAQLGWLTYLNFLALISISLGVLNLLPVPVLDGGHLMYYVIEIVKGSPVSERALEIGQQVGIVLLFSLMVFALYNDFNRLFGG